MWARAFLLAGLGLADAGCGSDDCSGAIALSAYVDTAAVLKADGSVWTWTQYQDSIRPARAMTNSGATGFANGQMCLRLASGDVSCPLEGDVGDFLPPNTREASIWIEGGLAIVGLNGGGPLGCAVAADGTLSCQPVPDYAFSPIRGDVRDVSIGADHTCAVTAGGTVDCEPLQGPNTSNSAWANAGSGPTDVVEIVSSSNLSSQSAVRTAAGEVWMLGPEARKVLGIDAPATALLALHGVFCALVADGRVLCWAGNDLSQFDVVLPPDSMVELPEEIPGLPRPAVAIAGGPGSGYGNFACTLLDDTTVWCWGAGFGGHAGQRVAACD